tara:strand:+ start:676 stop:1038 length:363 start_codon:yes stop_codon:yes gene_type:complete
MVEYFDRASGTRKRKEFAYGAVGKEKARKFKEEQAKIAQSAGAPPPKMKSGIKPGTKSPARTGHTPGVKGTGQTKPGDHHPPETKKKPEKEKVYVKDEKKADKKITVGYGGPDYLGMWSG